MAGMLDAEDFGLVGDGQTDVSANLKALRDVIRAGPDRVWVVDFDPGHYCYTDNTWWLFGDRDVVLRFNNSKVECILTHDWTRSWGLLPTMNPNEHWSDGGFVQAQAVVPAGTRFHSVHASADAIELFTPLPLAPGEVVLLAGHIQQIREMNGVPEGWGWPPNFRAYEYATVDSADGATVTLRGRLRHTYDEGWHDWEHSPLAGDVRRPDAIRREHEYLRGLSGRGASEASTKNLELSTTGNFEIQSRGNSFGGSTWGKVAYQLVFNRALSPAEVEQNRQALKSILAGRGITLP